MLTRKSSSLLSVFVILIVAFLAVAPVSAQEGAIVWSVEGINDLPTLDPARATDAPVFMTLNQMYSGLTRLDADLRVQPDLAESWEISDDGLVYTFTLREGIAFSDGTAITAEDVKWTLTHALDPNTGAWTGPFLLSNIAGSAELQAGDTDELSGVQVIDDRTVEITVQQPSAYFLNQLTFGPARITSAAQAAADPEGWADDPVTSGPFALSEYNAGQNIVLVPNENYWQAPTSISTLTMVFNQDSETAFQLFRTGDVDIAGSAQAPIPAARVSEVEGTPEFRTTNAFNLRYVAFNNELAPFDNVNVRRAFAMSVDKVTLADVVLEGTVVPADRIVPPGMPSTENAVDTIPFDPEAAQQMLIDEGINPDEFELTLTYGVEGDNERIVTVLQSMWQENLGITVTLEPLELTTFSSRLNDTFEDPQNGLQAFFSVWGTLYPDPQYFLSQILRSEVGNNNPKYSNERFDELVDEADVIVGDFARRVELYNEAEQIAVNEVAWLPLFNQKVNVLVRECVGGIEVTGLAFAYVVPDYSQLSGCAE